jgi:hypothetical protein
VHDPRQHHSKRGTAGSRGIASAQQHRTEFMMSSDAPRDSNSRTKRFSSASDTFALVTHRCKGVSPVPCVDGRSHSTRCRPASQARGMRRAATVATHLAQAVDVGAQVQQRDSCVQLCNINIRHKCRGRDRWLSPHTTAGFQRKARHAHTANASERALTHCFVHTAQRYMERAPCQR